MAETFEVPYERFGKVRNKVPYATLYLTEIIGGIACEKIYNQEVSGILMGVTQFKNR